MKKFKILSKKNKKQLTLILRKVEEILENPTRYKNLRFPLNNLRRVHIDKHFVLTFSILGTKVILEDYEHHDLIYKK